MILWTANDSTNIPSGPRIIARVSLERARFSIVLRDNENDKFKNERLGADNVNKLMSFGWLFHYFSRMLLSYCIIIICHGFLRQRIIQMSIVTWHLRYTLFMTTCLKYNLKFKFEHIFAEIILYLGKFFFSRVWVDPLGFCTFSCYGTLKFALVCTSYIKIFPLYTLCGLTSFSFTAFVTFFASILCVLSAHLH